MRPEGAKEPTVSWNELAAFLALLPDEDRVRVSSYTALGLPDNAEGIAAVLSAYAAENPLTTPSMLLATAGAQAGARGDLELAHSLGRAALELAEGAEDLQLAHVSLAQAYFKNRRDEANLEAFVEHCWEAIRAGHAGTFCYERLAALYEYRGEKEEAIKVCRRAVETLEAVEDFRSSARFQKRLERLVRK